ncbi:glycosyl hydrolase 108 family protein [Ewingella americana]|uniref:TtsA-like Glycoside hydrolase family 108 domain-containing protein n=1 Tax=Ewingella americana TaxID=41202 RepID=A0A502GDX5_9GAMM|nr:glycosyl hydrolase 108 family protein [Ewingella americana]TPG59951.1 hypothetical protein EAH77_15400 [Ewingella americana]
MAKYIDAYNGTIKSEGGFALTNAASDLGGYTYAGISRKYNPQWAGWSLVDKLVIQGRIIAGGKPFITPELETQVQNFYKVTFWDKIKGDIIASQAVAEYIFDFAVNTGESDAGKVAQSACKAGLKLDGAIGTLTVTAINKVPEELFLLRFYSFASEHYINEVNRVPTQIKYLKGWLIRARKHLI